MSNKYDFDAIIIGGGAAGLTAAGIAANFGAKTMMIEANRLGGDCTWTGCVPSKALLKAGKIAHHIRQASNYGLIGSNPEINFKNIIGHVHSIREELYKEADRPEIYEAMGIEVVQGRAFFIGKHILRIKKNQGTERVVSGRYIFLCTGSEPIVPSIKGLDRIPFLTNETLFEIDWLPEHLLVLGAGPIGMEMAQALHRLGAGVTVIDRMGRPLSNDDHELATKLLRRLEEEGVEFVFNAKITGIFDKKGEVHVKLQKRGLEKELTGDNLLLATGQKPRFKDLYPEIAGINTSSGGIEVDNHCRTNVRHIYACGDVTGRYQFTHMSEHMAKVAATNALLKYPMKIDIKHVPWVTYTDPELGHIGATEQQLVADGIRYEIYRFPYSKIDRAVSESEKEGMIKVIAKKWTGKILGASVYGARAGELISEYAVAMKNGVSLRSLADTIHPYPTYGLGARRAADQWYIRNQSIWQVNMIKNIFGYRGNVPDFSDPDRIV